MPHLSVSGFSLKNTAINLPENILKIDKISFKGLSIDNIGSSFDDDLKGKGAFSFYEGEGNIDYHVHDLLPFPYISFDFKINNIDLLPLAKSLSDEIYISGAMDVEGRGHIAETGPVIEITFRSKRTRGVRQVMNFGAVKVISSLGGGTPAKSFGSSNFAYSSIAGRVTIQEGYLTVEGLAGERGGRQFLVRSGLFGGINLTIDKETNTIKMEELIRMITRQLGGN